MQAAKKEINWLGELFIFPIVMTVSVLRHMLFGAPVPVHCAANEGETPDNVHNSHFILCDHKDAVSIKASAMMTRMGWVLLLESAFLKNECIFRSLCLLLIQFSN